MGRKKGTCGELSRSIQIFLRPDDLSSSARWKAARLAAFGIFSACAVFADAIVDEAGNLRSRVNGRYGNTLNSRLLWGRGSFKRGFPERSSAQATSLTLLLPGSFCGCQGALFGFRLLTSGLEGKGQNLIGDPTLLLCR